MNSRARRRPPSPAPTARLASKPPAMAASLTAHEPHAPRHPGNPCSAHRQQRNSTIAGQAGGSARGYRGLPASLAIPATATQTAARSYFYPSRLTCQAGKPRASPRRSCEAADSLPDQAYSKYKRKVAFMSAALLNVVIGLVTSILSGGSVWAWQRIKTSRIVKRKKLLFGLKPGVTCLIIINNKAGNPGSTSRNDVYTMVEIVTLAHEIGCPVSIRPGDDFNESNGNRTEFCIGGSNSNPRTGGHLASQLPGVNYQPYHLSEPGTGAIIVGGQRFLLDRGSEEYALVAKFTPPESGRPVILICGQTSMANRAAMHFLSREYRNILKIVVSIDRFCLIIKAKSTTTYGYQAAELVSDVTASAFAAQRQPSTAAGE
jgi:hypothetical protein